MVRRMLRAMLPVLALLLLSGCFMAAPDELYTLPQRAGEFLDLDQKIQEIMRSLGAEYAAPLSGSNTQTVQLQDLDGDGVRESAIAFFRVSAAEKPLKIYIFQRQSDGSYEDFAIIEGDGTAISSISYENLGGAPVKELVVSWQMSGNVGMLMAYSLEGEEAVELMRTGFTRFRVTALDGDNAKQIVVLQLAAPDEGGNRAELYAFEDGTMALRGSAPLSQGVTEIRTIRAGRLRGNVPALFILSAFGDGRSQLVDILAKRDGELKNITIDPDLGYSAQTARNYTAVAGRDVNDDGVLEIPQPEQLPEYNKQPGSTDYWIIHWQQYGLDGTAHQLFTTYHNVSDGWYLILPEAWSGQITVSRRDLSSTGERRVTFSRWNGEEVEPTPFLSVYMLIGANRAARAATGNRQILLEQSSTIYAFEFLENDWDCGMDAAALRAGFELIVTEWTTD